MAKNDPLPSDKAPAEPSKAPLEPSDGPAATPAAPEASEAPATVAALSPLEEIVERWFAVAFPGSPIAQTAEQWNFLVNAKEELKKLLPK